MGSWDGKRVVVLGLARQGVALALFLSRRNARVVVSDMRPEEALRAERAQLAGRSIEFVLGGHPLDLLKSTDLICLSGGVPIDLPIVEEARRKGIPFSNDAQIFLEETSATVVGITGSAGKTTTTMLVGRMAQRAEEKGIFRKVWVGGNIGNPLLHDVDAMQPKDLAVMELSSFQLDLMTRSPRVAAVLNITPNHLDRHHTMDAYRRAKAHILDYQQTEDVAVLNWEDPGSKALQERVRGQKSFFGIGCRDWMEPGAFFDGESICLADNHGVEPVISRDAICLRGAHNLANVAAACAISAASGIPRVCLTEAIAEFRGAPHRMEWVARVNGADWYDDSIATAPERAMAAIRSFDEPIILLAGGRDKKLPWSDWCGLVQAKVEHVVLFGEAAQMISVALGDAPPGSRLRSVRSCASLERAVSEAAQLAGPGMVVLLSPGGTSFDAFRDFEERGRLFRSLVERLAGEGLR